MACDISKGLWHAVLNEQETDSWIKLNYSFNNVGLETVQVQAFGHDVLRRTNVLPLVAYNINLGALEFAVGERILLCCRSPTLARREAQRRVVLVVAHCRDSSGTTVKSNGSLRCRSASTRIENREHAIRRARCLSSSIVCN